MRYLSSIAALIPLLLLSSNVEGFSLPTRDSSLQRMNCGLLRLRMTSPQDISGDSSATTATTSKSEQSRRSAIQRLVSVAAATTSFAFLPAVAFAANEDKVHISAYWNAVDGLMSLDEGKKFVSFDSSAYKAMLDDPARTPFFEKAIIKRLNSAPNGPKSQTVLDLGTGPFAVFAIIAAQAGAGKVYAIEANAQAVRSARATVKKLGFQDIIEVLEGFSNEITLTEKADFAVAEIVGSIASEEGAYATILDAHRRLIKEPLNPSNWIPSRIQTYASPASYTLHNLFQPPEFDWTKLNGEPVRFNCRDEGLQLLSDPMVVEDISFADIKPNGLNKREVKFVIDGERIEDNTSTLYEEFRSARLPKEEAEKMAKATGSSLSGIALWSRLILDGEGTIDVNSRAFPTGGHQKSHWQTVLPIMSDLPVPVKGGDEVVVNVNFDVSGDVLKPTSYRLDADIIRK